MKAPRASSRSPPPNLRARHLREKRRTSFVACNSAPQEHVVAGRRARSLPPRLDRPSRPPSHQMATTPRVSTEKAPMTTMTTMSVSIHTKDHTPQTLCAQPLTSGNSLCNFRSLPAQARIRSEHLFANFSSSRAYFSIRLDSYPQSDPKGSLIKCQKYHVPKNVTS